MRAVLLDRPEWQAQDRAGADDGEGIVTMRTYVFTEMPYPYIPPEETFDSVRVTFPNEHYDPELGFQLYQKYYDVYRYADELGLDIMCNEHHATATCVEPSVSVTMAILARETKRARLLALGK